MMALLATDDPSDLGSGGETPLVRAMAELALLVVDRIVVRAPLVTMPHETTRESEGRTVHEVIVRTGVLVRSPIKLLRARLGLRAPREAPALPSNDTRRA